jgi:hypothetical protein
MVTAMTATAMPMPVYVLARQQPLNGVLKIRLGATAGLDQCDASGCMRNKDVTQPVAAVATELKDDLRDISDNTSSST